MNILYLADPNSLHDLKWISYFSSLEEFNCFLIAREPHLEKLKDEEEFQRIYNLTLVGGIPDFSLVRPWRIVSLCKKIRQAIRDHDIDLIHVMYAEPNALVSLLVGGDTRLLLTTRGSDILVTIKAFSERMDLHGRVIYKAYKSAIQRYPHITCTSKRQIDELKNHLEPNPLDTAPELVRTGIDLDIANRVESTITKESRFDSCILFPRNMRPVYNHELAIDAIALLPDRVRLAHRFVFLDADSSDFEYVRLIRDKMQELGEDIFLFLPSMPQEDLFALYSMARLVVMTTTSDGSPVSAMEAMLFKVPLILPPLDYDEELFGGVTRFAEWTPASLSSVIENACTEVDLVSTERNHKAIASNCERSAEMAKVRAIYESSI